MQDDTRPFVTPRKVIVVLFILLIASAGGAYYFYRQANTNPQVSAQNDLTQTITAVGKLMVLPSDETPTLATVSDPAKLQDQSFFRNAKKGDKVLIYGTSHKAILYSPALNKIIEVAPINLDAPASAP